MDGSKFIIYNEDFEVIGEITSYYSILWHELYLSTSGGDFEIELPYKNYEYIKMGYYIKHYKNNKLGIIDTIEKTDDENKGLTLKLKGYMAESILNRRVIFPKISVNGKLWEVVNKILYENITNPYNQSRYIPNFGYNLIDTYTDTINKQIEGEKIGDCFKEMLAPLGYGFNVVLTDNGILLFSILNGRNNGVVINSSNFVNNYFKTIESNQNLYTHCIVSGINELNTTTPITSTDETKGINRRELFLNNKTLSKKVEENKELTDSEYINKLKTNGEQELNKYTITKALSCDLNFSEYIAENEDVKLGDIITIYSEELGEEYTNRILGFLYYYDENGAMEFSIELGNLDVEEEQEKTEDIYTQQEPVNEDLADLSVEEIEDNAVIDMQFITKSGVVVNNFIDLNYDFKPILNINNVDGNITGLLNIYDLERASLLISSNIRYIEPSSTNTDALLVIAKCCFDLTDTQYENYKEILPKELDNIRFKADCLNDEESEARADIVLQYDGVETVGNKYRFKFYIKTNIKTKLTGSYYNINFSFTRGIRTNCDLLDEDERGSKDIMFSTCLDLTEGVTTEDIRNLNEKTQRLRAKAFYLNSYDYYSITGTPINREFEVYDVVKIGENNKGGYIWQATYKENRRCINGKIEVGINEAFRLRDSRDNYDVMLYLTDMNYEIINTIGTEKYNIHKLKADGSTELSNLNVQCNSLPIRNNTYVLNDGTTLEKKERINTFYKKTE